MRLCHGCEQLLEPDQFRPAASVCRSCAQAGRVKPLGGTRERELHPHVEAQARHYRELGWSPNAIALALGIEAPSEWNRLVKICAERQYRRQQRGPGVTGPVHRMSGRYWAA